MHHKFRNAAALLALLALTACTSINCPLDSIVVWTLTFYDSETEEPLKLPCTLTVEAEGVSSPLFNQGTALNSMPLPMSNVAPTDTLYLCWSNEATAATDILYVDHTNKPHFEAIDCPAAIFHNITDARYVAHTEGTSPVVVDSVRIIRQQVDYNDVENIRIYLHNNPDAAVLVVDPDNFSGEYDVLGGDVQRND